MVAGGTDSSSELSPSLTSRALREGRLDIASSTGGFVLGHTTWLVFV